MSELFAADGDGRGPADVDPDDVAVMIPTSGTTGRSKLVMQTHRAYVMAGEGFPHWMRLTADDRLLTSLPLFHINAPAYSVLGSVAAGASLVLLESFSANRFLDAARRFDATEFNAIGAMLEILMRQPERDDDADNPLRLCYTGPSPQRRRHLEIEERFGLEVVCGYGLSETPYGLIWRHGTRPYGSLGSVRQHPTMGHINEARVIHEGRVVDDGEVGELELRNPAVMRGYYEMPDETAAVLLDGWLRTGDLVRVNGDDTYTFVGRVKQVIRRRGENLSPLEVEEVLESHDSVAEAAVIGVPSESVGGGHQGIRRPGAGTDRRPGRPARLRPDPARPFQGAPLYRGRRRAPPHPHRTPGHTPATARADHEGDRHGETHRDASDEADDARPPGSAGRRPIASRWPAGTSPATSWDD